MMVFYVIATIIFIVALLLLVGSVFVDNAKLREEIDALYFDNSKLHECIDNLEETFRRHGLMGHGLMEGVKENKDGSDYDFFEGDI